MFLDALGVCGSSGYSSSRKPRANSTVDAESTATARGRRGSSSFDAYEKIDSFPSLFVWPIEREINAIAVAEVRGSEVGHVHAESRVARLGVLHRSPAVHTPVHDT